MRLYAFFPFITAYVIAWAAVVGAYYGSRGFVGLWFLGAVASGLEFAPLAIVAFCLVRVPPRIGTYATHLAMALGIVLACVGLAAAADFSSVAILLLYPIGIGCILALRLAFEPRPPAPGPLTTWIAHHDNGWVTQAVQKPDRTFSAWTAREGETVAPQFVGMDEGTAKNAADLALRNETGHTSCSASCSGWKSSSIEPLASNASAQSQR
jgi:hypothetical protein